MRVSSSIAPAAKSIPALTIRRGPKRGTSFVFPSVAVTMTTAIIGRKASPVWIGENPSVRWR